MRRAPKKFMYADKLPLLVEKLVGLNLMSEGTLLEIIGPIYTEHDRKCLKLRIYLKNTSYILWVRIDERMNDFYISTDNTKWAALKKYQKQKEVLQIPDSS